MKKIFQKLSNIKTGFKRKRARRKVQHTSSFKAVASRKGKKSSGSKFSSILLGHIKVVLVGVLLISVLSLISMGAFVLDNYIRLDLGDNKTTWDGDSRINILVVGLDRKPNDYAFVDMAMVVVIDPESKSIGIFSIDPNLRFTDAGNRSVSIRRAYNNDLGGDQGIENVALGIERILAIDVDKYIAMDEEDFLALESLIGGVEVEIQDDFTEPQYLFEGEPLEVEKGRHDFEGEELLGVLSADELGENSKLDVQSNSIRSFMLELDSLPRLASIVGNLEDFERVETDFSKSELLKLYYFFLKVNSSNFRVAYTKNDSSVTVLTSYGVERRPLIENIDRDVRSIFLDSNIVKEQASVEILNGTETAGLATKYSRLLANKGIRIVRSDNSVKPSERTTIFVSENANYPHTLEELQSTFEDEEVINQEYRYKHIGDIVVVIGDSSD